MLGFVASPSLDGPAALELALLADRLAGLGSTLVDEGPALVGTAIELARGEGARSLALVVEPATAAHAEVAAASGLRPAREILQLRRSLPVEEPGDPAGGGELRSFVPGRDDEAWLAVNNRAFSWHAEQGGWTALDLHARRREPWFDPSGFLLLERDDRLAGFCWTKVHPDHDPPLGEIFVIGVDPDFHGLGLGRRLTLAGLDRLARQGLTVAMLYVESDNEPALRLYEQLGFAVHHSKRWFTAAL
jgi:mycothiol synthase